MGYSTCIDRTQGSVLVVVVEVVPAVGTTEPVSHTHASAAPYAMSVLRIARRESMSVLRIAHRVQRHIAYVSTTHCTPNAHRVQHHTLSRHHTVHTDYRAQHQTLPGSTEEARRKIAPTCGSTCYASSNPPRRTYSAPYGR